MKTLRDYQERAVAEAVAAIDDRPILVAPTGAGKTVMGVAVARRLDAATLWIAHRRELVLQAAAAVRDAGAHCGVNLAGERPDPDATVQVASVQTLARRELPPHDLVVIDECHHATAGSYLRVLERPRVLGLTATPFRLDGKGLGSAGFRRFVVAAYTDDLCAAGTLHAPRVFAAPPPDLSGVRITAGDYNLGALSRSDAVKALTGKIVETWKKRADGRRTVAFAIDVSHAETIATNFRAAGVPAEVVHGAMPKADRQAVLDRLAAGTTTVVANCMVLTEGWDLPAIEVAVVARPTASLQLHLQMVGRIMRACEGKDGAVVLDHAGNYHRHGPVTKRHVFSLSDRVKPASTGECPVRTCPECALVVPAGTMTCPECGHAWPVREIVEIDQELVDVALPIGHDDPFEQRAAWWRRFLVEACRIVRSRSDVEGFGWDDDTTAKAHAIACGKFKARYGTWPLDVVEQGRSVLVDPANATPVQWALLRQKWRRIGHEKGWPDAKVAWFVQKREAEARDDAGERKTA